jgi:hypothetical protein
MSLATDVFGNLFTAEIYKEPNKRGGISIIKYDVNHNLVWCRNIEGNDIRSYWITTDNLGRIYFTGTFADSIYVNSVLYTSKNSHMLLVKYDEFGNFLWFRRSTGEGAGAVKVSTDSQNNVYIAGDIYGNFSANTYFDSIVTQSVAGAAYTYIAKYNGEGKILWLRKTYGGGDAGPRIALKIDPSDNIYLAGSFWSWFVAGTYTVNGYGTYPDQDAYLTKMDGNGNWLWAKNVIGGTGQELLSDMDLDANGYPHITGFYDSQTVHFANITLTGGASGEYLVVKFDPNGYAVWSSLGCGPGTRVGTSLCVDINGITYVGGNNIYFSKIDKSGVCIGSDSAYAELYDMQRDNLGCIYLAGYIEKPTHFGSYNINVNQKMFIAEYCNDALVGVEEKEQNDIFFVSPNPAIGIINLSFKNPKKNRCSIAVKNLLGQPIYVESVNDGSISFSKQIDLSAISKGIYFVEFQYKDQSNFIETKKLILQ